MYNTFTNMQLDSFLPSLMLCCQLVWNLIALNFRH